MKLDILVLAAHPDDLELACSGTVAKSIAQGKKVGVVDFTRGEMGTRGTPEIRLQEAEASAKILGLSVRENLHFDDVFFKNDKEHQLEVVRIIRKYQPAVIIANAIHDRHPDHGKAASLVVDSCFISGLKKVETFEGNTIQDPWRPKQLFHMIQSRYIEPDFVVDITDFWDLKIESIKAFGTQFYTGSQESKEGDQTFISTPEFIHFLEARHREYGQHVGAVYAEGFSKSSQMQVNDLFDLI